MLPQTDADVTKSSTRKDFQAPSSSDIADGTPLRHSMSDTKKSGGTENQRSWVAAALPVVDRTATKSSTQSTFSSRIQETNASPKARDTEDQGDGEEHGKNTSVANGGEPEVWYDVDLNSEDEREYDMADDDDLDGEPEVLDTETVGQEQKSEAMERRRRMFPPELPLEKDGKKHD